MTEFESDIHSAPEGTADIEPDKPIKTEKELTRRLGFEKSDRNSDRRYREYQKPVTRLDGKEDKLVLSFDTVYSSDEKPYQYDRITLGMYDPRGYANIPTNYLHPYLKEFGFEQEEIPKAWLKSGGFQAIYNTLRQQDTPEDPRLLDQITQQALADQQRILDEQREQHEKQRQIREEQQRERERQRLRNEQTLE